MTHKTGQGRGTRTGQCPAHFSQATSETRLFRRTLTCPLYRLSPVPPDPQKQKQPTVKTMGYFFCGSGGDRTLVQTGNQYAFYMFISDFIVGQQQDLNHQLLPYPLKLHHGHEAFLMTIPDIPTPLYQTPRNKSF